MEQGEDGQASIQAKVETLKVLGRSNKMAKTKVLKKTHPISELDARMNPAVLAKAKKMAQEESLNIRLAILREKYGIKQREFPNFTQTAVCKLEKRKNNRISTLIDYLDRMGTARPRNSSKKELLLRV